METPQLIGNFDRGSKYFLERHGDSLLRLAGVGEIPEWRTVQPETIAVGQTPDGLLGARLGGRDDWIRFLVEFATYLIDREYAQLFRGVLLRHAAKGELPEAIVFVLHPKGTKRLPSEVTMTSPLGGTTATFRGSWPSASTRLRCGRPELRDGGPPDRRRL